MMRYVLLAFLGLGASISRAEGMLEGGAEIEFNKLLIHEDKRSTTFAEASTDEVLDHYFNFAHCACSLSNSITPIPDFTAHEFGFELIVKNFSVPIDRPLSIWTGTSCNDEQLRDTNCSEVATTPTVSVIAANMQAQVSIPIHKLMFPQPMAQGCNEIDLSAATWVLADGEPVDGILDYSVSTGVTVDTQAPSSPTNFAAVGAENAIEISWTAPQDASDTAYYQAMCAVQSSLAPGKGGMEPRFQTGRQLCGINDDPFLVQTSIEGGVDPDDAGGALTLPPGWTEANPTYLCAESATSTATGIRIDGLENGTAYIVGVLWMDKAGNVAGTYFSSAIVPQPVTDFWEDLHDQGSDVEGGFCLLSQAYGDSNPLTDTLRSFRDHTLADTAFGRWLIDVYYGTVGRIDLHGSIALRVVVGIVLLPFVVLALLWHLLTLPGLLGLTALAFAVRKRRLRFAQARLAAAATIALVALVPARAHAQSPYWEENEFNTRETELPPGDPMRVHWHAGIRVGPYVPGIDAQLDMPIGKYAGPYEQMFGGYSIMPMIDIDYFFLRSFGQLGVGASVGYMGKKEHAWIYGSDPMDPNRERASDWNKFRLIPFSLSAVYRLTYFDDEFGVPLVPYLRGGLAYYVWWVTAPNGDFAKSCLGPNTNPDCPKTTAAGASLGFVGSVGLSLRAERVDEGAARSMRESGIEHAGFYAEYSLGKVDGFGSDKKLSVGDATWFAGVDFEF
ncbi:MAG TPA: MXAN_2562 family outer membrane beta-barrel protein [Kofleriaceae bacterium]